MTANHTGAGADARGTRTTRSCLLLVMAALALLSAAGTGVAACGESNPNKEGTAAGEPDLTAGEQTYRDFCGSCHGRDLEGSSNGPSHLDAVYAPDSTTDEDFRTAITEGAPEANYDFGAMPAIGSLEDQEVEDVIAYIREVQDERGLND